MKAKNISIIAVFLIIIFGFSFAHFILPDMYVSNSERRKLEPLPVPSLSTVLNGKLMDSFEAYMLDQFPLRDKFRSIKAYTEFDVFLKKDNNGVYLIGDNVFKTEYPLKENQVIYAVNKINDIYETYLKNANVYYCIIPDKNYFCAQKHGYPSMDYEKMFSILEEKIDEHIRNINITNFLSENDYYRTDTHWRQECITDIANHILTEMGAQYTVSKNSYSTHTLSPFYGVYYGQSALNVAPDTLTYLTSEITDNASVWYHDTDKTDSIYATDKFYGMDGYDVFLCGAQSVITIENPASKSAKELVIFRDSYASSLSPLLIDAYKKITLIDIRYISSSLIKEYMPDGEFDALFLYSTSLLNNGMLLK